MTDTAVSTHTPGPWKTADKAAWFRGQRHPDEGKIAIQPVGGPGTVANAYGRENARLIAAAPDYAAAAGPLAHLVEFFGGEDSDEITVTAGELRALAAAHAKATAPETGGA